MSIFTKDFSDEEMARDWTLSESDLKQISTVNNLYRLYFAIQLCSIRLQGGFLASPSELSPRLINYLSSQLDLPLTFFVNEPTRRATRSKQHGQILTYLGFKKYDRETNIILKNWIVEKAEQGLLPKDILKQSEEFLVWQKVVLPSRKMLERQVGSLCAKVHSKIFETIYERIPLSLKRSLNEILVSEDNQVSFFSLLKESPPAAKISSLKTYLERYKKLEEITLEHFDSSSFNSTFTDYLFGLAKYYNAADLKRFNKQKRLSLLICFLLEARKQLLDNIIKMHDQFMIDLSRRTRNRYEKKHKQLRRKNKQAVDVLLKTSGILLNWQAGFPLHREDVFEIVDEDKLRDSVADLYEFKYLSERGYADLLISHYPSLRKYFSDFIRLPFEAEAGSEELIKAIEIIRRLDSRKSSGLPADAPVSFVPKELEPALKTKTGKLNRNAWEMGLALAIKENMRSGNLFIPKSKQYISFWKMLLEKRFWEKDKEQVYDRLKQPLPEESSEFIRANFHHAIKESESKFSDDNFAHIKEGKLKLSQDKKSDAAIQTKKLQAIISSGLPLIRIENLLMEVDTEIGFTRHFTPLQKYQNRPENFYKTLISSILSQATNLGIVAMSASVEDVSIDMLRYVLNGYIREETLTNANAEIVNHHHRLPISQFHGTGEMSSSDGQRFRLRADSLLASYYPRYYGYYDKAIGIYTHVSDQYSVFNTKVISCSPREALYVLDGLLENNTILQPKAHTTDTHGYTEIIFALCNLLGFYFMPRIRDLKKQQLYKPDKNIAADIFSPLLKKSVNLNLIAEQWDAMIRVTISLKNKTVPAHLIVERLTNSSPSDRLSRALTDFGRLIKTQYILRYISDPELRRTVRIQLNKGEYRHKLPRWIFFANQGIFNTSDFEEIMNKASCLSLVSNCILYWNTKKIGKIIDQLTKQGEEIDEEILARISLLPYKHVLPQGTYFVESK
jgi:TnpA family transposase